MISFTYNQLALVIGLSIADGVLLGFILTMHFLSKERKGKKHERT